MNKLFITLTALLAAIMVVTSNPLKLSTNLKVQIVSTDAIPDLMKQYPNAIEMSQNNVFMTPATLDAAGNVTAQSEARIIYYFGKRINNDFLVARDAKNYTFGRPQNVQTTLTYPQSGVGNILTYVTVDVRQSNFNGKTWIAAGGIGQRYIKLIVEASNTTLFNYDANFYGY